jgi:hypothetical protein
MFKSPLRADFHRSNCRMLAARVTALTALALCLFASLQLSARAQTTTGSTGLVISQVYTRGGEAGASYQNDFVEIFNRSAEPVDMNNYGLHIALASSPSPTTIFIRFASSRGILIQPGKYILIRLKGDGVDGQPLPFPDFDLSGLPGPVPLNLSPTSGTVALLAPDASFMGCPTAQTAGVVDYVGYGAASTCFEGPAGPAPAPAAPTDAIQRELEGCADNNVNAIDFHLGPPLPRNSSTPAGVCTPSSLPSFFNFGVPQFDAAESDDHAQIIVTRTGDTSTAASVEYVITGGTAFERSDYTTTLGRLRFAPGETQKSFDILLTDDATQEQNETVEMLIWKPEGGGAGIGFRDKATLVIHDNDFGPAPNPVETSEFFVRQHYHDFLNREPDAVGLNFWTKNIESCGTGIEAAQCREVKRIDTSAAFFLSIEFQRTGFLVYRLYRASLPAIPGRTRSMPRYAEFVRDTQEVGRGVVVNQAGWEQQLEANTAAFVDEFVRRADFAAAYPASLTPAEYVDKLNAQAGGALSNDERDVQVGMLTAGFVTRAQVLRKVAESGEFTRREIDPAFVLMQYFGYLRRAPNDPPNTDFSGFDFWFGKLEQFGGDYRRAEMVKAFITSDEYRARFSAPLP